jgi:hypothetical protein
MKEFLEKISSYNLFNYFLPGILYAVFVEKLTSYSLISDNLLVSAFLLYFIGLIISRVGSIFVEPPLKYWNFLKFKSYSEYVEASRKDPKLDILSEQNNTYRSIISLLIMVGITKCFEWICTKVSFVDDYKYWILVLLLLVLFLFSYRKQTKYIFKRIEKNLS